MGTRHMQKVIDKKGVVKVNQYGQWDGYPSGQGVDILNFLRTADLEKYQENLSKLKRCTNKILEEVNKIEDWPKVFPWLSRDCGARIHTMILNGEVPYVYKSGKEASAWCEGFYTIDFQKRVFSVEFHGVRREFSIDYLPDNTTFIILFLEK